MASRFKLLPYEMHLGKIDLGVTLAACMTLGGRVGRRFAVGVGDFGVGVRYALWVFDTHS